MAVCPCATLHVPCAVCPCATLHVPCAVCPCATLHVPCAVCPCATLHGSGSRSWTSVRRFWWGWSPVERSRGSVQWSSLSARPGTTTRCTITPSPSPSPYHHHPITITSAPPPITMYNIHLHVALSLSLSVRWQLLHHRLVGIMLLVYINPDLLECVSDQQVEYVTTGMGGLMVSGMMSSLHHHHPRMKVGLHLVSVVCLPGQQGWSGSKVQPIPHVSVLPQLPLCSLHGGGGQEEPGSPTLTLSPPPPPPHSHSPPHTLPLPPSQDYHTIRNKMLFDKIPDYKYSIMEHE